MGGNQAAKEAYEKHNGGHYDSRMVKHLVFGQENRLENERMVHASTEGKRESCVDFIWRPHLEPHLNIWRSLKLLRSTETLIGQLSRLIWMRSPYQRLELHKNPFIRGLLHLVERRRKGNWGRTRLAWLHPLSFSRSSSAVWSLLRDHHAIGTRAASFTPVGTDVVSPE